MLLCALYSIYNHHIYEKLAEVGQGPLKIITAHGVFQNTYVRRELGRVPPSASSVRAMPKLYGPNAMACFATRNQAFFNFRLDLDCIQHEFNGNRIYTNMVRVGEIDFGDWSAAWQGFFDNPLYHKLHVTGLDEEMEEMFPRILKCAMSQEKEWEESKIKTT